MKFKKLVAALSAVTMLGSLVVVPASAESVSVSNEQIIASKVFQVRGKDATMKDKGAAPVIKKATDTIEMTYANTDKKTVWFGAVYYFDIPNDVTITDAKLEVPTDGSFKMVDFTVVPLEIPSNVDLSVDNVFQYVAEADITNATNTAKITNNNDKNPLSGNIKDLFENNQEANAFFVYKANQADDNPRRVMGTATLTVSYTYELQTVPDAGAQVGRTQYTDLSAALAGNADNSKYEVKLLKDYSLITGGSHRLTFTDNNNEDNKNFNIKGKTITISADESKTITVKENETAGGLLVNRAGTLNLNNINIYPYKGSNSGGGHTLGAEQTSIINVSGGKITGDVKISGSAAVNLDNATVTGKVDWNSGINNASISLANNAKVEGSISKDAKSVIKADSTASIGTLTVSGDTINDGDVVVTKTGETNLDPSQVTTLTNDGYELYTDDNGNLAIKKTVTEETQEFNYAFTKTLDELEDTVTVTVNTSEGTASNTVKKPTTNGAGSIKLGVILKVPSGITVNSVTIE